MTRMFSERIKELVLSMDIMGEDTFFDLLNLIQVYVNRHLEIVYFSVLDEAVVNDRQGLKTLWSTREEKPSYTVDKDAADKKDYKSHSAYTFGENQPVWVVSDPTNQLPLQKAGKIKNLWPGSGDLPPYSAGQQEDVCTSVMHPLRKEGKAIGVVEFAAKKYIKPTPASLEEATRLADIISTAYQMYDVQRVQQDNTKKALQMLEEDLATENWARLALPRIFVAYAGVDRLQKKARAKNKPVIDAIRDVVSKFKDRLTAVYWEDITEPGNITEQVIREIINSELGLCYFSEPGIGGNFEDNKNVLFEAGMMQALANSPSALLRGWIPIREEQSDPVPFDIAAERILVVDRQGGKFNSETFKKALRERMDALVATLKGEI